MLRDPWAILLLERVSYVLNEAVHVRHVSPQLSFCGGFAVSIQRIFPESLLDAFANRSHLLLKFLLRLTVFFQPFLAWGCSQNLLRAGRDKRVVEQPHHFVALNPNFAN